MRNIAGALAVVLALAAPVFAQAPVQYAANISWADKSDNEDSFRDERNSGGMWGEIATVPADTTTFTDEGPLDVAKEYCYRVVAINVTGASVSPVVCDNTPAGDPPLPVAPSSVMIEFVKIATP